MKCRGHKWKINQPKKTRPRKTEQGGKRLANSRGSKAKCFLKEKSLETLWKAMFARFSKFWFRLPDVRPWILSARKKTMFPVEMSLQRWHLLPFCRQKLRANFYNSEVTSLLQTKHTGTCRVLQVLQRDFQIEPPWWTSETFEEKNHVDSVDLWVLSQKKKIEDLWRCLWRCDCLNKPKTASKLVFLKLGSLNQAPQTWVVDRISQHTSGSIGWR